MNLLALPLEREQIYSIKRRFPGYSGKVGRSLLGAMPQRYPKKLASGQKKTSRPFLAAMAARRRPAQTKCRGQKLPSLGRSIYGQRHLRGARVRGLVKRPVHCCRGSGGHCLSNGFKSLAGWRWPSGKSMSPPLSMQLGGKVIAWRSLPGSEPEAAFSRFVPGAKEDWYRMLGRPSEA